MQDAEALDQSASSTIPFRDPDGAVARSFAEAAADAIESSDAARLRTLTRDLHEADLGDLLEALSSDERPRLIELLGRDFDFSALREVDDAVREEILDELEPGTVAEGVKELASDDAVAI